MKNKLTIDRRQLLKWTAPLVAAITLPVHAQTSFENASFTVEKEQTSGPNPATAVGDVIGYTITLVNTGSVTLTNVVVVDTLPSGNVGVLSSVNESLTSDGVFEVGETWVYTIDYTVTLDDLTSGSSFVNTVNVSTDQLPEITSSTATTPVVELCACSGPPVLSVQSAPKCSGNPPVGTAFIDIFAADECGLILKNLSFTTTDDKSDLGSFPLLPITITDTSGQSISWIGPASDGVSCLPSASIFLMIEYCCPSDPDTLLNETYDISQLLIDSITT